MSSVITSRFPARTARPPFYMVMSLLMAAVIIGGFSQTVPDDLASKHSLPLLLHVHAAVFTLWLFVFVSQPIFIQRGSLALHRRVGWLGAGTAVAMVIMALWATFHAVSHGHLADLFPPTIFLVMNILGIAAFASLVTAGVRMRKKAEWHKRLMLCATVSILGPGLGRLLPMENFGNAAPLVMMGCIMAFALAGPVHDLIRQHRVHPAYLWGVSIIFVSLVATGPLAQTPLARAAVQALRAQAS